MGERRPGISLDEAVDAYAKAWAEEIEASDEYRDLGRDWTSPVVFVLTAQPELGLPRDVGVYLDLAEGRCREARAATEADRKKAAFVLSLTPGIAKAVFDGTMSAEDAFVLDRITIERGNRARLASQVEAFRALFATTREAAGKVDVEIPEEILDPAVGAWAKAWAEELDSSDAYRELGQGWTDPVVFVLTARPELGPPRDVGVYLDLAEGHCREARAAAEADRKKAPFVLSLTPEAAKAISEGTTSPEDELMFGRLTLERGSRSRLAAYTDASYELFEAARRSVDRLGLGDLLGDLLERVPGEAPVASRDPAT